jgi:hypothetical protein
MSYMVIYKTTDNKWHLPECEDLSLDNYLEHMRTGGSDNPKCPHRDNMCPKCFDFLLKSNTYVRTI